MMTPQNWPIQTYSKLALAMAYFPQSNYDAASRHLNRWIKRIPELVDRLRETGYNQYQRHFNARQVALIYQFIGEP